MADQISTPDSTGPGDVEVLLANGAKGRPYGAGTQLLVIGVHGTNNGPANVRDITERIGGALGNHANVSRSIVDTGFDWTHLSPTQNNTEWREVAAEQLTARTLTTLDEAYKSGALQRDKPLVIMYAGFSHGGNVALLASDETALGLRQRGITNAAIHQVTLSTPAYTWGEENPGFAARETQRNGVQFAHTHFSIAGDGVIRAAIGNGNYPGPGHADPNRREGVTTNFNMSASSGLNGLANHGAPQDSDPHMEAITRLVEQRFRGLAPAPQRRADADGVDVAFAQPGHPHRAQYEQLLGGVAALGATSLKSAPQDTAAALLDATVRHGFDPAKPVNVIAGLHDGTVFAVQGDGPGGKRVRVDTADVVPGSATQVADTLAAASGLAVEPAQQQEPARVRTI